MYNELMMMMMTMMIVFRGLITVTVKISSFFVGENGWQCSRPVWRPSTDFVLPSVWPLVYKHAVNYTSVRRNDLTPLLRFVVDLLCNLFIQLVQHLTRFRLTSRPAVHLCTNVWQKKTLVSFIFVLMICIKDKLGINLFVIFYTVLLYNWLILRVYFYAKLMFSKLIIFADNFHQQRC